MNTKHKAKYDRAAVGKRLKDRRQQLEWSRKYVADRVGLVEKYYADIERGTCGMSVETLIALASLYGFTIDGLIYGVRGGIEIFTQDSALLEKLEALSPGMQNTCRQMLNLFISGVLVEKQQEAAEETVAV